MRKLDSPLVRSVRGGGLWFGVVFGSDCAAAVELAARRRGLLVNAVKPDVLRLAPPLIVTSSEIGDALRLLQDALDAVQADQAAQAAPAAGEGA